MDNNNTDVLTVDNPADLHAIVNSSTSTSPAKLRLLLLQPLQLEETLTACREHATTRPTYPAAQDNHKLKRTPPPVQEVLDLKPLFKAWRSACAAIEPDNLVDIIFDVDLPASVKWARSQEAGLCVVEGRVSRFLQGLATVMSVRSKGRAKFELGGTVPAYIGQTAAVLEKLSSED